MDENAVGRLLEQVIDLQNMAEQLKSDYIQTIHNLSNGIMLVEGMLQDGVCPPAYYPLLKGWLKGMGRGVGLPQNGAGG